MGISQHMYLRSDVVAEPLVDRWYAWSHIISPATAAMHVAQRHVRIMNSYLEAPDVHATAAANLRLRGGPFMDLAGERTEEVRHLLDITLSRRTAQLSFAKAVSEAATLLRTECKGMSLEPFYARLPQALRGYVELVYDLESHAGLRFFEPLLYRGPVYDRTAQSLMLYSTQDDNRAFVLSTPRFEHEGALHVSVPFDEPALDDLFACRDRPGDPTDLAEKLGIATQDRKRFESFFSGVPAPAQRVHGDNHSIRWRYFGHACVLVEYAGQSILIDPVARYGYSDGVSGYSIADFPERIDYVLITHNHQDHLILEMLLQLRHKVGTVVVPPCAAGSLQDPSTRLLLRQLGFKRVIELGVMESIPLEDGEIVGLPFLGEHGDLDIRSKLAYLVRLSGKTFVFAADSCNIEPRLYELLRDVLGPVDSLFVGMECDGAPLSWVYGPLLTTAVPRREDQSRRTAGSDCAQAWSIVETLRCRHVYVYAMGQEPWLNYISRFQSDAESLPMTEARKLLEICRAHGIDAEQLCGSKEMILHHS
ncbi:MAG: MBL fold metallo-hydrolase [Pseudomonadota bacterium]|nr:MBL fold metallo-hydrolase [Pseudomonadota bacterium]